MQRVGDDCGFNTCYKCIFCTLGFCLTNNDLM